MFVEQVFAVEQVLRVLHEGNRHHLTIHLDQHVVFNLVLGLVLIYQIGHRLQLTSTLQLGEGAHRNHGGIER